MGTGIEIGSYCVKAVRTIRRGTKLYLTGISKIRWNFGEEYKEAQIGIEHSLKRILSNFDFRIYEGSTFGVSGRDVNLRIALLPPVKTEIQKMVEYEVLQFVGKGTTDLSFDYVPLNIKSRGYEEIPVFISMARANYINEVSEISNRCNIKIKDITPNAIGLYMTYLFNESETFKGRALIWDIGHNNMEVVVVQEKQLLFARNLSAGGGRLFTEALVRMHGGNIDFDKAEALKLSLGNFYRRDEKQSDAIEDTKLGLQNIAAQFTQIYNSTLQFIRTQLKIPDMDIERIYLCGGCGAMRGLDEFLKEHLKKDVVHLNPFKKVDKSFLKGRFNEDDSIQLSEFACCFGLSLIGEISSPVKNCSLLPENVKEKRARLKRWSLTIAGIILILSSALFNFSKNTAEAILINRDISELESRKKELENELRKLNEATSELQKATDIKSAFTKELSDSKLVLDLLKIISEVVPKEGLIITNIITYPVIKIVKQEDEEDLKVKKMVALITGKYLETGSKAREIAENVHKKLKEYKNIERPDIKGDPSKEFSLEIHFK